MSVEFGAIYLACTGKVALVKVKNRDSSDSDSQGLCYCLSSHVVLG